MKKSRNNKGITLIALIITIIVMLILVGVSIQIVINSNLFNIAQNAGDKTKTAYEEEGKMSQITIGDKTYESIEEYLNGPGPKLAYSVNGNTITISLADSALNYVANKSLDEKEQKFAEAEGASSIDELINNGFGGDRQAYETAIISAFGAQLGTTTYIDTLNMGMMELYGGEYLTAMEGVDIETPVTVTDPSGVEHELSYMDVEKITFKYKVQNSGNYKFIATNAKGSTSEVTVPLELQIGTFALATTVIVEGGNGKTTPGETIGTFEFVIGSTWGDFIGEAGELELNDDVIIMVDMERVYAIYNGTKYPILDSEKNSEFILVNNNQNQGEIQLLDMDLMLLDENNFNNSNIELMGSIIEYEQEIPSNLIQEGKTYYLYE